MKLISGERGREVSTVKKTKTVTEDLLEDAYKFIIHFPSKKISDDESKLLFVNSLSDSLRFEKLGEERCSPIIIENAGWIKKEPYSEASMILSGIENPKIYRKKIQSLVETNIGIKDVEVKLFPVQLYEPEYWSTIIQNRIINSLATKNANTLTEILSGVTSTNSDEIERAITSKTQGMNLNEN